MFFWKSPLIGSSSSASFKAFKNSTCLIPWSSIVFLCFSKAFPKGEQENLASFITLLWSEGSISSPVRYSYLSSFPSNNDDIFAASLLLPYYDVSSLILSSIVMISFYILSKRFFLKREGLSDTRVASVTKKQYGFDIYIYIYIYICKDS